MVLGVEDSEVVAGAEDVEDLDRIRDPLGGEFEPRVPIKQDSTAEPEGLNIGLKEELNWIVFCQSPWPLFRLRENVHLPAVAFAPVHPLQLAGSLPGIASALCGALLLGTGHAYAQRPGPRARFLHAPPLVERPGPLTTGPFLSPSNTGPRRSLASA